MNHTPCFVIVVSIISALLIGCSPYASQYAALDAAYAKGEISADRYYSERGRVATTEQQWRANMAQSLNTFNQNNQQIMQDNYRAQSQIASQYQQSLLRQQEINAYNQRTQILSQPQRLNLNHSGTINHNVYGY
jgi:hypothetical protein